jgi:TRAP-type C4-dicarboxylate transport system permease small subunit
MKRFGSIVYRLDISFHVMAGVVLAFMLVFTVGDVIMRSLGKPIVGSIEAITFSGAIVACFAIPYSSWKKSHIYVDLLTQKLGGKPLKLLKVMTRSIGILLFLFISYNFIIYGLTLMKTGEVSAGFKIPYYPLTFLLAAGCFLESLTLVVDLLKLVMGGENE